MSSNLVVRARRAWRLDGATRGVRVVLSRFCTLVAMAIGSLLGALAFLGLPIVGIYLFLAGLLFGLGVVVSVGAVGKALSACFGSGRGRSRGAVGES